MYNNAYNLKAFITNYNHYETFSQRDVSLKWLQKLVKTLAVCPLFPLRSLFFTIVFYEVIRGVSSSTSDHRAKNIIFKKFA